MLCFHSAFPLRIHSIYVGFTFPLWIDERNNCLKPLSKMLGQCWRYPAVFASLLQAIWSKHLWICSGEALVPLTLVASTRKCRDGNNFTWTSPQIYFKFAAHLCLRGESSVWFWFLMVESFILVCNFRGNVETWKKTVTVSACFSARLEMFFLVVFFRVCGCKMYPCLFWASKTSIYTT